MLLEWVGVTEFQVQTEVALLVWESATRPEEAEGWTEDSGSVVRPLRWETESAVFPHENRGVECRVQGTCDS